MFSFFYSCTNNDIFNQILNDKDTTIEYEIPKIISSEGNQVIATYRDGIIINSTVYIFGETGKLIVEYVFKNNVIEVSETHYQYKKQICDIWDSSDMEMISHNYYTINYGGDILEGDSSNIDNIFLDFSETIPFTLRK